MLKFVMFKPHNSCPGEAPLVIFIYTILGVFPNLILLCQKEHKLPFLDTFLYGMENR